MVVVDEAAALSGNLRGQVLRVPGEDDLYGQWSRGISPMYEKVVAEVNQALRAVVRNKRVCRKVVAEDPALFASLSYFESGFKKLKTMAFVTAALMLWDDVLDQEFPPEYPNLKEKLAEVDEFRQVSISYVRDSFFTRQSQALDHPPNDGCAAIREAVPAPLGAAESQFQRELFVEALRKFLSGSKDEQKQRASGKLPDIEEYWRFRLDTGAGDVYCALHQYMANTHLPPYLATSEEIIAIGREASQDACLSNYLLSLRKELVSGSTSNACIIVAHKIGLDLQEVTEHIQSEILESHVRFDEAACRLKLKASNDSLVMQEQVGRPIQVFENYQTGAFTWCVQSQRYGVSSCRRSDGSLEILL